jgi:NADH-quinone oxidoreductase subunit J
MQADLGLLCALIIAAVWTVMTRSLLRAAIGLALVSVILSILMFSLNSPLAAVFELSVCAGLIPVLFISAISLTEPLTPREKEEQSRKKMARFWFLPFLIVILAVVLSLVKMKTFIELPVPETIKDARTMLWNLRPLDLLGQVMILLAGAFGIVVLFKEKPKK